MKYIVYLTTNLVNNKIYIGVHKTENPDIFDGYLGNHVNIHDRSTYFKPKYPFQFAVRKYGPKNFKRTTLKVFDNKEDALDLERWLVCPEFIARKDTYNVALGDNIPPAKRKQIYQYDLEGNFIKEWCSITEAALYYKVSSSSIGRAIFNRTPIKKYLWTDFKLDKIDLEKFKIDSNKKKIFVYDTDGNLILKFKSLSDCSKYFNESVQTLSTKIAGKYQIQRKYYISDYKYEKFPIEIPRINDGFYQYDLEGNFIRHINNNKELQTILNIKNTSDIYRAIRTGNTAYGYQWNNTFVPKMKQINIITNARKVGKYTLDSKLVTIFNTVREAKQDTCGCTHVLKGSRKTAGGYLWKYIE